MNKTTTITIDKEDLLSLLEMYGVLEADYYIELLFDLICMCEDDPFHLINLLKEDKILFFDLKCENDKKDFYGLFKLKKSQKLTDDLIEKLEQEFETIISYDEDTQRAFCIDII